MDFKGGITISVKPTIYLEDIAEKMEEADEEWQHLLNTKTGEFVSIQLDHLACAEDMDEDDNLEEYSDWEREAILEAVNVLSNWDDYAILPSQHDIHEYRIMESYALAIPDASRREKLLAALNGKSAFRRFKDSLFRIGLEKEWYEYRFQVYIGKAREWCQDNRIAFKSKRRSKS